MAWLGKLFGGTVGFMFGGPLGMIAGIAFGHMFDKAGEVGTQGAQRTQFNAYTSLDREQMLFFVGAFSMLARIASADGSVSSHERQKVMEFIRQDLRLGLREEEAALRVFDAALTGGGTFEQFATQFYQNFSHAPNILQLMIDIFYRVASADGQVSQREEDMIRRAAQIFHLPESFVDMLCNRYGGCTNASDKAYATLNISRTATDDEVKRAYRKLSIEFHPDSLASKGMGEEFLTHATAKFREIQEAYDSIKRERGIK
ncbi:MULTISPECIES: TerB family tellurite resistance protein [Sphaerochaeta]|jgi:DnaJ like chaperone protein|uniref:TerB family tellurite resistance protein n=1 Tax=Sphaerochaeta associata TaxID=1129264 RepID=A0ABY4DA28_9SPIR|nr:MULTISPECIES: TerB family tellurite resistance protein [Sphaerochaeta]MDT3359694.1 TerB family tellurite resistance protein [Spirochaetota bacterium]NLA98329.1 DnaJ domain-containing protein [Spirochaetales bacterium]MDD2395298.1 TerB family tellurite resistance protein [Sphaerochaeta sp.]MDD3423319.1 TerB family tellurite resistance protein [Sphaerochaeta sp.]MDD3456419.1 TerB family tellurite resistance protein [Sphaerochaeta sp.]